MRVFKGKNEYRIRFEFEQSRRQTTKALIEFKEPNPDVKENEPKHFWVPVMTGIAHCNPIDLNARMYSRVLGQRIALSRALDGASKSWRAEFWAAFNKVHPEVLQRKKLKAARKLAKAATVKPAPEPSGAPDGH
jgi:hypothetical protein